MFSIRNQTINDQAPVDHLLDLSFGADRKTKSAYTLRQGLVAVPNLALAAEQEGELVGSIQFWPLKLDLVEGSVAGTGIVLLGPLAVHPERQNLGLGQALIGEGLKRAAVLGYCGAILVGDPAYYGRFGFDHGCVAGLTLSAEPVQSRVQGYELTDGSLAGLRGKIISAGNSISDD
ncbi:MAG: N-acetyltransferase [Alphaproteobacteria bacterium]|nr:N-acetyltransferase [Alphaproteobacteria bacterium]MBT5919381.1 N-acetyltransferase [Alphaproteobacteria bacterium]